LPSLLPRRNIRAVSSPSGRVSAMLVLGAATALAAAAGAVYGGHAAIVTGALLAVVAGGTLALAHAVVVRRARLGSLRRQFAFAVGIAVGQVPVATGAGAMLMFVSPHDAFFMLLIATLASVVGARGCRWRCWPAGRHGHVRLALDAHLEGERAPARCGHHVRNSPGSTGDIVSHAAR
jgi:hypothetical protein